MNFKRSLFVGALMILFLCCYHIMNQHYDELSRYQYTTEDNRKVILEHLSTEDINYLIDRQYKPEVFMCYLGLEGFNIRYVDWYNYAKTIEDFEDIKIIETVNVLKDKMTYTDFKVYGENYSLSQLRDFFMEENSYVNGLSLISNPTTITNQIDANQTLFTYVPKNLVEFNEVPIIDGIDKKDSIMIREDVVPSLVAMCQAAFDLNQKTCGNMIITQGYVSFEKQEEIYQKALLTYGIDDVLNHVDYPGQSMFQLGNVIEIVPVIIMNEDDKNNQDENQIGEEKVMISEQQKWLMEHAKEYGFEFVNDPSQPLESFILQYNGVEVTEVDEKGVDE